MIDLATYFEPKIAKVENEIEILQAKIETTTMFENLQSHREEQRYLYGKIDTYYEVWRELAKELYPYSI